MKELPARATAPAPSQQASTFLRAVLRTGALAAQWLRPCQGFDGEKQILYFIHAKHAGAADRRVVDVVRPGKRPCMRRRGSRPRFS